jgi:hypothetical protein
LAHRQLIFLRCTAALLKQLGGKTAPDASATGRLGDWDAKVVATRPKHLVLCTNERTLLCTVIPLAPAKLLRTKFAAAAEVLIRRIPAPSALIAAEVDALADIHLGRARDRSVRSSMTHFGYAIEAWLAQGRGLNLEDLSLWLCDTPCFPLETNWPWLEAELVLTGSVAPGRRPLRHRDHVI